MDDEQVSPKPPKKAGWRRWLCDILNNAHLTAYAEGGIRRVACFDLNRDVLGQINISPTIYSETAKLVRHDGETATITPQKKWSPHTFLGPMTDFMDAIHEDREPSCSGEENFGTMRLVLWKVQTPAVSLS